jgi:hypothetical protein
LLPEHQRRDAPHGYFNLGVAHGVAGVLPLLAGARAAGLGGRGAAGELEAAVAWLLAREQGADAESRFDNWVAAAPDGSPAAPAGPQATRLAWCYGDLGMAAALHAAARGAGEAGWAATALSWARSAAHRLERRSGIEDAGLCHGAAGAAHLFNRLAQAAGDAVLEAAALGAYRQTLELRRPGRGVGGFLAWEPSHGGWRANPGFLTGAAGVGLALLAGLAPLAPQWDRVLGLSLAPPGSATGRVA